MRQIHKPVPEWESTPERFDSGEMFWKHHNEPVLPPVPTDPDAPAPETFGDE